MTTAEAQKALIEFHLENSLSRKFPVGSLCNGWSFLFEEPRKITDQIMQTHLYPVENDVPGALFRNRPGTRHTWCRLQPRKCQEEEEIAEEGVEER